MPITALKIPGSVKRIPVEAFANCCSLKELTLSEGIEEIENSAFECAGCVARIENLNIPSSVTKIGDKAFSKYGFLKYVTGIDAADEVSASAFVDTPHVDGWQSLMLITENNIIKGIDFETRYDEGSITNGVLAVPEGVIGIADGAFSGEECFSEVVLPSSLKTIGTKAFESCKTLVSVKGGANLERVGRNVFDGTPFFYGVNSWSDVENNAELTSGNGLNLVYVGNFIVAARGRLAEAEGGNNWEYALMIKNGTTGIADGLFKGMPITSLKIPGSVKRIPVEAFANCCSLKELTLSEGIEEIEASSFECAGCVARIENLNIPSSVTKIGDKAFSKYGFLKYVTGIDAADEVSASAFVDTPHVDGWQSLMLITENNIIKGIDFETRYDEGSITNGVLAIPEGVIGIADGAFSGEECFSEVVLPSTLKTIGTKAFESCKTLVSVKGGANLERVGRNVFDGTPFFYGVNSWSDVENNAELTSGNGLNLVYIGNFIVAARGRLAEAEGGNNWEYALTIKNGTTGIADGLFKGMPITSLKIPGSVKRIPVEAFANCCSLKGLTLGEGIEEIEASAFECAGCVARIENLNIPSSVTKIGDKAFSKYGFLKYVTGIDAADEVSASAFVDTPHVDGWQSLMLITENNIIKGIDFETRYDEGSITNGVLAIPEGVIGIADGAFSGEECFSEVVLPSTLKTIGTKAFESCKTLVSVKGGANLERVGRNVFDGTPFFYGVNSWSDVENNAELTSGNGLKLVYVGNFIVAARGRLAEAEGNSAWEYALNISEGTTGIADGLFKGMPITSLKIPGSVKRIPVEAFANCCSLKELTLSEGIEEIENSAFECAGCKYPTETLVIPASVRTIGERAFAKFAFLKWVTGLDKNDAVNGSAFVNTPHDDGWLSPVMVINNGVITKLEWVTRYDEGCITNGVLVIPEGVTTIAANVFNYDINKVVKLERVVLPKSLENIGDNAFKGCVNLRKVEGGAGLKRVGREVFNNTPYLNGNGVNDNGLELVYLGNFIVATRGRLAEADGAKNWEYALTIKNGTTGVADGLFEGMAITALTIPGSLKSVAVDAFKDCRINSLTIEEGVEEFLGSAFSGNKALSSVVLPLSMVYVGEESFSNCAKLSSLIFKSPTTVFNASAIKGSPVAAPELSKIGYHVSGWSLLAINGADKSLEGTISATDASPFKTSNYYGSKKAANDKVFINEYTYVGYDAEPVVEPNSYYIAFNANGASGAMATQEMTYDKADNLTPNQFVRSACDFLGWATSPNGNVVYKDGAKILNLTSTRNAVLNFYAVWRFRELWGENSDDNGGTIDPDGTVINEDAPFSAEDALVYDGYVLDGDDCVAGSVLVKAAKAAKKSGISKVTITISLIGQKKITIKTTTVDGVMEGLTHKDGRVLDLVLGGSVMYGNFDGMRIEGTCNLFSSKDKEIKKYISSILDELEGCYSVVLAAEEGNDIFSVEVKSKGKVKVTGYLMNGTKVSINTQLIIGKTGYAIPVSYSKKNNVVSFMLWIRNDGTMVIGNCEDKIYPSVAVYKHNPSSALLEGSTVSIDFDSQVFTEIEATVNEDLLPNGFEVVQSGSKWKFPKASNVKYKNGEWTVSGDNPSGLKLSYKSKSGLFSGSFYVYALVNNKLKKYSAKVYGLLIEGSGVGIVTIKKPNTSFMMVIDK